MLDGYAEVKIEAVTPGAELEGVIYDQWVTIRSGRTRLELFDQDCICPESLVGTRQRVRIGMLPTRIVPSRSEATSMNKNTFVARVMPRNGGDEADLIDVLGIPMRLMTDRKRKPGSFLEICGRLDLLDIEGVESGGWRNAPSNH